MRIPISVPPTANLMYRKFGGRMVLQDGYRRWMEQVSASLNLMADGLPTGPISVDLTVYGGRGFPESRDGDNCLKPVLDAIKQGGLIVADDSVRHVRAWGGKYFSREEHWQCLHLPDVAPKPRAKDLDGLMAICVLRIVPHVSILEELP